MAPHPRADLPDLQITVTLHSYLKHRQLFEVAFAVTITASAGTTYEFGPIGLGLLYEMRKDLLVYVGIVCVLYGYQFILNRPQGEARFLATEPIAQTAPALVQAKSRQQFLVKMLNKEYLVRVAEIDWIQTASNYVLLHCGARSYPMRGTLAGLAVELDQQPFMRVHRTAIVNLNRVESLSEADALRATLNSGDQVPVSRTYLPELKKALAR